MKKILKSSGIVICSFLCAGLLLAQTGEDAVFIVKKTDDFNFLGYGSHENWLKTDWVKLVQLNNHENSGNLSTKAKVLYSDTGLYFLFVNQDRLLTATMDADFMEIWNEDVVEVFFWPDENSNDYFEYELSPLNYELLLLLFENGGSWQPFNYHNSNRQTRHETSVEGGEKESGAMITQWTAEFFIPYNLLRPLNNTPPQSGSRWRANLYRIDYDDGQTLISWQPINRSFHEYNNYGTFLFE